MSQHEYYIRQPSDTESHGPFTLAQLSGLARSGGLDASTLYFDAGTDQWLPVAGAPELAALLPEDARAASADSAAPPLAGRLVAVLLAASGFALLFPAFFSDGGPSAALEKFQQYPYLWLGVLDFILALCCLAFGVRFFMVIRIRAGLGIGFLGALFWLQANTGALVAAVIVTACLWLAAALVSARALVATAIAGLAAAIVLAYCLPG